jgi:MmgE/PrpD N-terminal domain/MmgE/PrpD C-terminal domain
VASIAHDWDDYLFMGHTGHSAVPAAAAFSGDPERALVAQVAANEVAGRLGAALFLGPHNGQFWASIHCASAAVAASVGLGLDAERAAHALAIALYQPPYGMWPGFMGPGSKLLTAAEPAAVGARAALLAAEGVTGALDVIEHPRGVLSALSFAPRPAMFGALGRVWLTDTLAYKRLPGCAYLQSVGEAALAAGVDADEIASVEIEAGWLTCEMEELGRGPDLTPIRVNFSATLTVAIALLAGRLTPAELAPSWLDEHETEIRALAARIELRHDPALTAATLRGSLEAGASPDLGLGDLLRIRRRLGDANMAGANPAPAVVRALRADRDLRGLLGRSLLGRFARRSGGDTGIDALDTTALRMTFPSRLRIRLRDGSTRLVEGSEPGSCGRPLPEQRAVVEERMAVAGLSTVTSA